MADSHLKQFGNRWRIDWNSPAESGRNHRSRKHHHSCGHGYADWAQGVTNKVARLWKVIDGEPFMVNPQVVGILGLNPSRKKRRGKKMARRSSARHMAWVRSFKKKNPRRRHRRARRNPYPVAGFAVNRRRARRSHRRRNPVMRRHRRARRNPSLFGFSLPPLQSVLYAGVGFVGVPMAEGVLSGFLPVSITSNTIGRYAIRIGAVIGLSTLARMVIGRDAAKMVGIGGGAYVLTTAVREFAPGMIPGMSAYTPALRAYTPMRRSLGAPAFGATNTPYAASGGASNVVAARFRRFQ